MNTDDYLFANFKPKEERDLFCQNQMVDRLRKLFVNGLDISILIHGPSGIGKKTTVISLLKYIITDKKSFKFSDFEPMKTVASDDYGGLFRYNNIYYLDCKNFTNTEFSHMINKLVPIFKSRSIVDSRKIFIMTNLDTIIIANQQKIANVIEKFSTNVSFIFTSVSNNKIAHKIRSLVCKLNYVPLNDNEFKKKFYSIFKNFFDDEDLMDNKTLLLNKFYIIYKNNNNNIGNTLHQINYLYLSEKLNKKELSKKINLICIMDRLVINLINTIIKSNTIKSYEILKEKIYKMKSLTMDDIQIIKSFSKNIILMEKMDNDMKHKIIELCAENSESISKSSKPVILLENFVIKLWAILKNINYD